MSEGEPLAPLLRTLIEEVRQLRAELRELRETPPPPRPAVHAKGAAHPPRPSLPRASRLAVLEAVVGAGGRELELVVEGLHVAPLIDRVLLAIALSEAGSSVPPSSGTLAAFWQGRGAALVGPNAGKALRLRPELTTHDGQGYRLTDAGRARLESLRPGLTALLAQASAALQDEARTSAPREREPSEEPFTAVE